MLSKVDLNSSRSAGTQYHQGFPDCVIIFSFRSCFGNHPASEKVIDGIDGEEGI
jgi:hypothetical protein